MPTRKVPSGAPGPGPHAAAATSEMTIDELARAGDVATSTVRMYQHRGLLPPPTKRGRVGWYGEDHLERLRLIAQLQARGFSLAAIKELLDGMAQGESLQKVLGLGAAGDTWTPETPTPMPFDQLAAALPQVTFSPETVRRVMALGLVDFAPDGAGVIVQTPSFLDIGSALAALGVAPDAILDEYEALRDDADRIAGRFTDVFRTAVWEPYLADGMPPERLDDIVGALEQLGPLAEHVVIVTLRQALQRSAETFVRAEADRLGIAIPRPGAPDNPATPATPPVPNTPAAPTPPRRRVTKARES